MLNYFQITPETPNSKALREKGWWNRFKENSESAILGIFMGGQTDDALEAYSVRNEKKVTFESDLKNN
jgi:hypothetical protein